MDDATRQAALILAVRFMFPIEGCRLTAYLDTVAKPPVWTIGHGTTRVDGKPVYDGMVCTLAQADTYAEADLESVCAQVLTLVHPPLEAHQLAALLSLVYNIGAGNFARSKLLSTINLGVSHYVEAAAMFVDWDHVGTKEVPGLKNRRQREAALFLQAPPAAPAPPPPPAP